jgi:hypothetical protein
MANGNNTGGDSGSTGDSGASYSSGDVSVNSGFGAGNTNTTNADYSGQNYDVASGTFGTPTPTLSQEGGDTGVSAPQQSTFDIVSGTGLGSSGSPMGSVAVPAYAPSGNMNALPTRFTSPYYYNTQTQSIDTLAKNYNVFRDLPTYDVVSGTFGLGPSFPHTPTPSPTQTYDVASGTFGSPPIPSQTDTIATGFGSTPPNDITPWTGAQYPDIFFAGTHIADLAKGYTPAKGVPAYFDIGAYGAYEPYVIDAARLYGLDVNQLTALIFKESKFNPYAISPLSYKNGVPQGGAIGLGQIEPATAKYLSTKWGYTVNPGGNPIDNIYASARYLSELQTQSGGDINKAMRAYSGNTPGYGADVNRMAQQISKVDVTNLEFPTSLLSPKELAAANTGESAPSAAPTPSSAPAKTPGTITIPGIPGFTSPTTITLPTLPSPDTIKTTITNVVMGGSPGVAPAQSGSTGYSQPGLQQVSFMNDATNAIRRLLGKEPLAPGSQGYTDPLGTIGKEMLPQWLGGVTPHQAATQASQGDLLTILLKWLFTPEAIGIIIALLFLYVSVLSLRTA